MLAQQPQRQPDILEVISDLSNDEVFTPPRVASAVLDLLPVEVWSDPSLRWLDPGCKTGVFPREIIKRLMVGLVDEIPAEDKRLDHIVRNMVFGVAITALTSMISRRTVYCSKDAMSVYSVVHMPSSAGNMWYELIEHPFERTGRCAECGASKDKFGLEIRDNHAYAFIHEVGRQALAEDHDMQFDVIVGNPPYQMQADAAGKNVIAIYDRFVTQARKLAPRYITMVIPSRWMTGGRGLDDFRDEMLGNRHLRELVDYPNSAELFPDVDIKSGICYFLWDRDNPGPCAVTTSRGGVTAGPVERELDEFDVLVRDSRAVPILGRTLSEQPSLAELVSPRDPFGSKLGSNFRDYMTRRSEGDVRLYANQATAEQELWVNRTAATRNLDLIDRWKVFTPKAGPGNSGGHVIPDSVLSRATVAGPGSVCSATYLVIGPLPTQTAAESVASYLRTRFVRFLVSLRKPSQNTTRDSYRWVPQQTWDREWTDEELYATYELTEDEQAYINEMIREMPA